MALFLTQNVSLFVGDSAAGMHAATLELHDDTFVLKSFNWKNPETMTTVMDVPLSELRVGGSMATLTFTAGDVARSVDFASGAGGGLMSTDSLLFRSAGILDKSGIYTWLNAFRGRGVPVKYRSLRQIKLWGALGAALIVVIIGIVVAGQM